MLKSLKKKEMIVKTNNRYMQLSIVVIFFVKTLLAALESHKILTIVKAIYR